MKLYTWKELNEKYGWDLPSDKKANEKVQCAKARGVVIQQQERKNNKETIKYSIIEEFEYFTRDEIISQYDLQIAPTTASAQELIKYCEKRGILLERLGLVNKKTTFKILNDDNFILEGEIWKDVENTSLKVSNFGRVKGNTGRIKSLRNIQGYLYVTDGVYKKTWRVHRLVLLAFSPIKDAEQFDVDHINGIRTDNKLENLRWVTTQRNIQHREENQNKIGELLAELIQDYGYEEIYNYLVQKRKPKTK